MSNPLRKLSLRAQARDVAKRAAHNHERGIQYALDFIADTREQLIGPDRARTRSHVEHVPTAEGWLTQVSLVEDDDESGPTPRLNLTVATRQDPLRATDDAAATPVSYTTKLATIINDEDGNGFLAILWHDTAAVAVGAHNYIPAREPGAALWGTEE